jgi:hypothetical protein
MNNNTLLFHIGYHKTATSFLQQQLFEKSTEFNRINQYEINRSLIYPGPFHFDEHICKEFITENTKNDVINVFSNERLSGGPHSGGRDSKELANRIKKVAPNAKILIAVREQFSAILSSYNQYIKAGGSLSLNEYIKPKTKRDLKRFRKEHFEYHHLVGYYIDLFGKENVLCVPFCALIKNEKLFINTILDFLKLSSFHKEKILKNISPKIVNKSFNYRQLFLLKYLNPFIHNMNADLGTTYNLSFVKLITRMLNFFLKHTVNKQQSRNYKTKKIQFIIDTIGKTYYNNSNNKLNKFMTIKFVKN